MTPLLRSGHWVAGPTVGSGRRRPGSCWLGLAGLLAAAAAGCSAGQDSAARGGRPAPLPPPAASGEAGCFYVRDAQDFQVLNRTNLIVYAPTRSRAFHVQISPPSPDLRYAERIAFVTKQSQICGYAGDAVVLNAAGGSRRYTIVGVSRLSAAGLADLLDRARGTEGEVPEPRPTGSADVVRELESDGDPAAEFAPELEKSD